MSNDILESVSQRVCGEETPQNRRIRQVADELRRRCELYEAQFRDGEKDVNNLDVEQRVAEQFAKENGLWISINKVFDLGTPGPSGNENDTYVAKDRHPMCEGKDLPKGSEGTFEWELRPELVEAVKDYLYWYLVDKFCNCQNHWNC